MNRHKVYKHNEQSLRSKVLKEHQCIEISIEMDYQKSCLKLSIHLILHGNWQTYHVTWFSMHNVYDAFPNWQKIHSRTQQLTNSLKSQTLKNEMMPILLWRSMLESSYGKEKFAKNALMLESRVSSEGGEGWRRKRSFPYIQ